LSHARACTEHVRVIALCSDQAPHFATIAHFVSTLSHEKAHVFAAVVATCDAQGLIGHEMFAMNGVTLSRNASKQRSGTREEIVRQTEKFEPAAQVMVQRGPKGTVLQGKGNRTVNHSATTATSNGVTHGCTGVAAVDAHTQIIIVALLPRRQTGADVADPDASCKVTHRKAPGTPSSAQSEYSELRRPSPQDPVQ